MYALQLEWHWTYQSLHHEHPLLPDTHEEWIYNDRPLGIDPLQQGVQQDEGAGVYKYMYVTVCVYCVCVCVCVCIVRYVDILLHV